MEQEKLCVIKEKSYEAHIDEKVHAVTSDPFSLVKPRITRTCRT